MGSGRIAESHDGVVNKDAFESEIQTLLKRRVTIQGITNEESIS